jgi:hypothetical protein
MYCNIGTSAVIEGTSEMGGRQATAGTPAIAGRPATERPRKNRKDDSTAPAKTIISNNDDVNKKSH